MKKMAVAGLASVWAFSGAVKADQFHYNNVILGERAQGMGGAYSAVADDASGVFYNPAGLAFAQSNDISGSANAVYGKEVKYKAIKELGNQDFQEKAGGTFAPFFGILQKLDKHVPGLVGAFAYYTKDTELKDQNDVFEHVDVSAKTSLDRYHRSVQHRAATTDASAAFGYRLAPNIAVGLGLGYVQVSELTQEFQYTESSGYTLNGTERSTKMVNTYNSQNLRQDLTAHGMEATLGLQIAISNFSIGAVYRKGAFVSQHLDKAVEVVTTQFANGGQSIEGGVGSYASRKIVNDGPDMKTKKPLGTMPGEVRLGAAWFASTRFLWTGDISYHEEATGMEVLQGAPRADFIRKAVVNYHTGAEFYILPTLPLRIGAFTNKDTRPDIVEVEDGSVNCNTAANASNDACISGDKLDWLGQSVFLAWVQPNSQIALGTVIQEGSGKSRKVAGSTSVQKVEGFQYTIGFSATQSF